MKNAFVAIAGVIVGALLLFIYNVLRSPAPPTPGAGPCNNPNEICIPVYVDSSDPPQILVRKEKQVSSAAVIFWEIGTSGYTFPQNGIEFSPSKPVDPAPPGEFTDCVPQPGSNNTRFRCNYKGDRGRFGYTVSLTGPVAVPPLDPWVVNQ